MKKKISKKLELSKETLRELTRVHLGQVAGGTYYWSCPEYTCQNEDHNTDSRP